MYRLAAAIGLALNVTVTEFVDTVCSRHILACMTPSYILESFHVRKTIQIKISRMSNNGKAKIFYHEIMVVWHNTVLQCGKNGRGQVNIFWHVLRAVYCLLGPKILVTPLASVISLSFKLPYISELKQGTNRSLVLFTSLVISSDNVNRGLVLLLLLCLIYKPGHN